LTQGVHDYNEIEGNVIKIKKDFKKKGKEYGIFTISKAHVKVLVDAFDLMSTSPSISPKFSEKFENYLHPRFNEILGIVTMSKTLPEQISIEMSKENQKEVLNGFTLPSVSSKLRLGKVDFESLVKSIKEMKMVKFKE
jgi:hypothetical protein